MKIKIAFFGSDQYSQIVLKALQQAPHLVISGDEPDVGVLASYGQLVPTKILTWPKKGILNLHPSLLPKYRGASPVQFAILNGERQTGLTIIKMDEKIDHGPIVSQFTEAIRPDDTAQSLYQRLFSKGAEVLKTILPAYLAGKIKLRDQDHSQATYTRKLTRDDGRLDWSKPPEYLERQIRAFYPWPGTWTEIDIALAAPGAALDAASRSGKKKKRLKIIKAHLENGQLILDQVQLEGKKPVTWKQFREGYPQVSVGPF